MLYLDAYPAALRPPKTHLMLFFSVIKETCTTVQQFSFEYRQGVGAIRAKHSPHYNVLRGAHSFDESDWLGAIRDQKWPMENFLKVNEDCSLADASYIIGGEQKKDRFVAAAYLVSISADEEGTPLPVLTQVSEFSFRFGDNWADYCLNGDGWKALRGEDVYANFWSFCFDTLALVP